MQFKFQHLAYFLFAGLIGLSSCGDDDETTPTKVEPYSFTAKLLGAQSNAAGSFFSPKTGMVYGTGDSASFVANGVDISFGQTGSPTTTPKFISLSARKSEGLTKANNFTRTTYFDLSSMTKAQFDTVSSTYIAAEVLGTSTTTSVQQGKVYEFTNAEGKSGLIYVSNLDAGTGVNGSVTIDVKFEK